MSDASSPQPVNDAEEIEKLKQELSLVKEEIKGLEDRKTRYDEHIKQLHTYNEIKDVAQMLLGQLAEIEGVRNSELYPRFGLQLDD